MTLTQKDVDEIERIVDEKLEDKFPNLSQKIDKLITMVSNFVGRVDGLETEQTVQSKQLSELNDKVIKLEDLHPHGMHAT